MISHIISLSDFMVNKKKQQNFISNTSPGLIMSSCFSHIINENEISDLLDFMFKHFLRKLVWQAILIMTIPHIRRNLSLSLIIKLGHHKQTNLW